MSPRPLSPTGGAYFATPAGAADWVDGKVTAGAQSGQAKRNLQVPENSPAARTLGDRSGRAGTNELFTSASLALRVFPPLFNRYDAGMAFGSPYRQRHPLCQASRVARADQGAHRSVGDIVSHRSRRL